MKARTQSDLEQAVDALQGTQALKAIVTAIDEMVEQNIDRLLSQGEPMALHRAQGAVADLRSLRQALSGVPDAQYRRSTMRREV